MEQTLTRARYEELRRIARRWARRAEEADDLLHEALIVAIRTGRAFSLENRAWLSGVMRNLAAMDARSAARRKRREQDFEGAELATSSGRPDFPADFVLALSDALRIVALLAAGGHTRAEILYLLRISDDALRQRLYALRRKLAACHNRDCGEGLDGLRGNLAFGAIRSSLLPVMRTGHADFASHDPDGHALVFRNFESRPHKFIGGGNKGVHAT